MPTSLSDDFHHDFPEVWRYRVAIATFDRICRENGTSRNCQALPGSRGFGFKLVDAFDVR
jgi:hypothetical protein